MCRKLTQKSSFSPAISAWALSASNGQRVSASVLLNETSTAWLVSELGKESSGRTVVVTHHLPATPSIARRYRNDDLNPAVARRLEDVIETCPPDLWIHGIPTPPPTTRSMARGWCAIRAAIRASPPAKGSRRCWSWGYESMGLRMFSFSLQGKRI